MGWNICGSLRKSNHPTSHQPAIKPSNHPTICKNARKAAKNFIICEDLRTSAEIQPSSHLAIQPSIPWRQTTDTETNERCVTFVLFFIDYIQCHTHTGRAFEDRGPQRQRRLSATKAKPVEEQTRLSSAWGQPQSHGPHHRQPPGRRYPRQHWCCGRN